MSRSKRAADRIREEIPIIRVLADYGYAVDPRAEDYEQQFCCDLHGDGQDNKPSARVYPGGGQFFCFACGRSRDVISLVREKEGLEFWKAVKLLEGRYGLEPLPWEPEDERPATPLEIIEESFKTKESAEDALQRLNKFLSGLTRERALTAEKCAGLWEAYDRVTSSKEGGEPEDEIKANSYKILRAAKKAVNPDLEG